MLHFCKNNMDAMNLSKYTKFKRSPIIAYLLWVGFSIILILISDFNLALFWIKKMYLPSSFIFVIATNIYMDYPVNYYIYGNKEIKRQMRKNLGIDETLSEVEQEKHPLIKKIKRQHFCTKICIISIVITSATLTFQGYTLWWS